MVATEDFTLHELDAWRPFPQRFQFFNLMGQTADFCFIHFHRAELDTLLDGNAAVLDDPLPFRHSSFAELLKHAQRSRGDGCVDAGENAKSPGKTGLFAHRGGSTLVTSASTWATTLRIRLSLICMVFSNRWRVRSGVWGEKCSSLCFTPRSTPHSLLSAVHTPLIHMHRVDNADDDRVDRHVFCLRGGAHRYRTLGQQDEIAHAGS